jgi:hypothetical protein
MILEPFVALSRLAHKGVNMRTFLIVTLICVFFTGCTLPDADPPPPPDTPVSNDPTENPITQPVEFFLPPQPGDEGLERGQVFLDSTDVLLLESFPVQVNLLLKGALPTPCHQARFTIKPPDAANTIRVELYSLVNPDQICIQVLQSFNTTLSLGSFGSGHYFVTINGELTAEFDI